MVTLKYESDVTDTGSKVSTNTVLVSAKHSEELLPATTSSTNSKADVDLRIMVTAKMEKWR